MTPVDFYGIEDQFSDEERMIRDTIAKWVEDKCMPDIQRHFREETFPAELVGEMGEMGMFGATLSGYGCPGLSNAAYGLICQELERCDAGLRSFVSVQGALVMYPIHAYGSDAQKETWLPAMAKGEKIGCFGLTEADHGSDPGSMKTRAKADGDHYILNGGKFWITNGSVADVALVWARDDDGHVGGFLVEKGTPGFSTRKIEGKFSMRASVTSELSFSDCRIPRDNRLPGAKGLRAPLSCLSQARYGISWGAIGSAMACYEHARQYAIDRIQFGKPIASFQLVQQKLVFMLTEITKAQLLSLQLARLKDAGNVRPQQISMAKRNNVWMALETARKARDILGAAGIVDEHPIIRHLLNLETVITYEGTHDIHTLILGQDITGISAFGIERK